ncbi:hypothetical protein [Paludibacterium sp.]|uniref:hypothetical protein n=1 Tax=Paludibacterium sp. TaxID=1917523 RepID=UPI0025DC49DC|nr:hypothetical protein [Paludibacterium sp.]MBV8646823.1 hypothetical protein [Paludibacterium sp.]
MITKTLPLKTLLALLAIALLLSGCADHVTFAQAAARAPVGFLHGIWHGMILPFAWAVSLFDRHVAIYAIYNNGAWYDFGYFIGAAGVFGGGASSVF